MEKEIIVQIENLEKKRNIQYRYVGSDNKN